jgi:multiple sugar transport system permease protein
MAKRATTSTAPLIQRTSAGRSKRIEAILGRDWKVALPFVLPLVVIMAGLIFWPFINAILLSFTVRNIVTRSDQFVGLANYGRLWNDAEFRGAVNNTILFTVASVACKFVVGMTIALLLNSKLPFRNVLTGLMLLPWIVPEVVTALAWKSIFDPIFGGLNPILLALGLIDRPRGWLCAGAAEVPGR